MTGIDLSCPCDGTKFCARCHGPGDEPECNDDHSSCNPGQNHCPIHGYDGSVPAPAGFQWYEVQTPDGIYTALMKKEN